MTSSEMSREREAAIYTLTSQAMGLLHAAIELMEDGLPDGECEHPDECLQVVSVMGDAVKRMYCSKCGQTFDQPLGGEPDGEAGSH